MMRCSGQSKLGMIPGSFCWGCGGLFLAQTISSSKAAKGKVPSEALVQCLHKCYTLVLGLLQAHTGESSYKELRILTAVSFFSR